MANYAVVDNTGTVVNVIEWDGVTPYKEPSGFQLVLDEDIRVGKGWTYEAGNFSPPVIPPPTAQQLAAAAMSSGLLITSTGTPELNGTYGLDQTAQNNVSATVTYILLNGTFPGGGTSMPWVDAAGDAHIWPTTTEFKAFATAFANFVAAVSLYAASNGAAGSIPSNEVTIR